MKKQETPYDTGYGMDPEMAQTLQGESRRQGLAKRMAAPDAFGDTNKPVKHGMLDGVMAEIKRRFFPAKPTGQ